MESLGQDNGENERKDDCDKNGGNPGGRARPSGSEEGESVSGGGGGEKKKKTKRGVVFEAMFEEGAAGASGGGGHKVRLVCLRPRCSL